MTALTLRLGRLNRPANARRPRSLAPQPMQPTQLSIRACQRARACGPRYPNLSDAPQHPQRGQTV